MPIDPATRLYFEAYGPEAAPTIVFLHGAGAAGWMWRAQVNALQADYHCLAPDLPEQGRSAATGAGPYTTEGAAERVAELIRRAAHAGRAHVVGLSEGAQVVVALLSRAPELVDHAVVSSAILRPLWMNKLMTPGVVALSYRWFMAPFKHNDWWIRLNMHSAAGITDEYFADFKRGFQETTEAGLKNMMASAFAFRLPPGLERADRPVLVVAGRKEYQAMRESARDLLRALPNARGALVSLGPKSSLAQEHNWPLTAPDLFTAAVRAFVEDRPLPDQLGPLQP